MSFSASLSVKCFEIICRQILKSASNCKFVHKFLKQVMQIMENESQSMVLSATSVRDKVLCVVKEII